MNCHQSRQVIISLMLTVLLLSACGEIPSGTARGILVDAASGESLAERSFLVTLLYQEDASVDEESCIISGSIPYLEGYLATDMDISTDASGAFSLPGRDLTIPPGTYIAVFVYRPGLCFMLRDENGNIKIIEIGSLRGVDLGEVFTPAKE